MRRWPLLWMLAGYFAAAGAIEAPLPASAGPQLKRPQPSNIEPVDATAFYQALQRSAHHRALSGLSIRPAVIDTLARGDVAAAIAWLEQQAAAGDNDANIALVRIQHWCNRFGNAHVADSRTQIEKLPSTLAPERAARAAGVILAEERYRDTVRESCARAQFDFGAIEQRLRQAALEGDPASATELAQFTRDAATRRSMLQAAADKGFGPAQHALATRRLIAVQRGENTEDVASIRLLLKQAGRSLNKAKVDLANCMALGCDGHPADAAGAAAFGIDAARDGEPSAFLSMARMPWGMRMNRAELLAWQYFGDRLSEAGCVGDNYVVATITFDQTIKTLEQNQSAELLGRARARAEQLWRDHGERAMREQGCSPSAPG